VFEIATSSKSPDPEWRVMLIMRDLAVPNDADFFSLLIERVSYFPSMRPDLAVA
jgi:hypothetical protein